MVVVVVAVVVGLDIIVVVGLVAVIDGHRNLTLKFNQNWVNNKSYIVVVVVVIVVIVSVLLLLLIQSALSQLLLIQF